MKIINVNQTRTLKFIPRIDYPTSTINLNYSITDEQTNKSETTNSVSTSVDTNENLLTASVTFGSSNAPFREGHFYTLEVKKTDNTLAYRDKLFCTAQSTQQSVYNVNNNEYTTNNTFDNDYIVL